MVKPCFLLLTALFTIACESSPDSRPGAYKLEKPVNEQHQIQLLSLPKKITHKRKQVSLSFENAADNIVLGEVSLRVAKTNNGQFQISLQKSPLEVTAISQIEKTIKTSMILDDMLYDVYLVCKDESCKILWLSVEARYLDGPSGVASPYILEASLDQDQSYSFGRIGTVKSDNPSKKMTNYIEKLQQNRFLLLDFPVEDSDLGWLQWPES